MLIVRALLVMKLAPGPHAAEAVDAPAVTGGAMASLNGVGSIAIVAHGSTFPWIK